MARYTEAVYQVKKLVPLTTDLAERIRAYRFEQRLDSENEAIRQLIEAGLKAGEKIPTRNTKPSGGEGGTEPRVSSKPGGKRSSAKTLRPHQSGPAKPLSKEAQLRELREHGRGGQQRAGGQT